MTKYYILDTETTGLDPAVHGIIDATFIGVNIRQVNGATEVNRGGTHVFQFPLTFADNLDVLHKLIDQQNAMRSGQVSR